MSKKPSRADGWPWEQTENSVAVAVEDITRDTSLQVRSRVEPALARKYAHEMRAGAEFPPVELAAVGGRLVLLDGWHRLEAAHVINGSETVEATVREMTKQEATWRAAEANMKHGKPYTAKEKRALLKAYVKAGRHRDGKILRSYREIGKELFITLGTLHRWIEADHPKLARAMAEERPGNSNADAQRPDSDPAQLRRLAQTLRDARGHYAEILGSHSRGKAIALVMALLEEMKQTPHESHPLPW